MFSAAAPAPALTTTSLRQTRRRLSLVSDNKLIEGLSALGSTPVDGCRDEGRWLVLLKLMRVRESSASRRSSSTCSSRGTANVEAIGWRVRGFRGVAARP